MLPKDTYKHQGMRRKLLSEIMDKGITDERVLAAMMRIPRHFFFEKVFIEKAYEDKAFPIGEEQTISQPSTVALQTQLLQLQKNDRVLEIGTGSAYQAAVLASMGNRVISIERNRKLHKRAKHLINQFQFNKLTLLYGDGYEGAPAYAPFDKVIITAAPPSIPTKLIDQMKINGIMVLPFGNDAQQELLRITKISDQSFKQEVITKCMFVPMLKGTVD